MKQCSLEEASGPSLMPVGDGGQAKLDCRLVMAEGPCLTKPEGGTLAKILFATDLCCCCVCEFFCPEVENRRNLIQIENLF